MSLLILQTLKNGWKVTIGRREVRNIGLFSKKEKMNTTERDENIEKLLKFLGISQEDISSSKLTSTTYYACMLIRCNAVAKLPVKLQQKTDQGSEIIRNHQLHYLLKKRPNIFTTPHDFKWATEFQRLEYGNAYWVTDRRNGVLQGLYLLDSRNMQIVIDNTQILTGRNNIYYVYQDPLKGELIYSSDEIVHLKNFSMNGLEGTSVKKYISETIEHEQYSSKVLKGRYKSGLQDPIIVQYVGDLNEALTNKIKKKFADLGGAKNAGKVVPIPTEFKVSQLETKLVNSQFFQLQGLTTRHIANAFGIKGFQLNDMEKSTYNNIEQQNKAFYSDTLQNVLTEYEEELDYKLLTKKEQSQGYNLKFNVDSVLRSDLASRTASYQSGINYAYMTVAEVRAKEDLPYIGGTEKLIWGNGASIPFEKLGEQYDRGEQN